MRGFFYERWVSGLCIILEISEMGGGDLLINIFNIDFYFGLM